MRTLVCVAVAASCVLKPDLCGAQNAAPHTQSVGQAPYPAQPYPAQTYPAQTYPAQPYPAQTYPAQTYPAQVPYQQGFSTARQSDATHQNDGRRYSIWEPQRRYLLAFGGGAAFGGQGFDREGAGTMLEFALRMQIIPLLGIGLTFGSLNAGNEFRATLVGVNASLHLVPGTLFVPYARIGPVNLIAVQGRREHAGNANARGWGVEAVIGGNFTFPHFAVGPNIRIGQAAQPWTMIGVHLECRM